jgi:hypothetical protein
MEGLPQICAAKFIVLFSNFNIFWTVRLIIYAAKLTENQL